MRRLLDAADLSNREWAPFFPNGVINFKREFDKEENHFVPPICDQLHREIMLFRRRSRTQTGPLFPSPVDPSVPCSDIIFRQAPGRKKYPGTERYIGRAVHIGLYEEAVMLAARYLESAGMDPGATLQVEPLVPKEDHLGLLTIDPERFRWKLLYGHKFHRWRSNFATRMELLDWGESRDHAGNEGGGLDGYPSFIASWVPSDGSVRSKRYVDLDPQLVWLCSNGVPGWKARPMVANLTLRRAEMMEARLTDYADQARLRGSSE